MKRIAFCLCLAALVAPAVFATSKPTQRRCSITEASSPAIRGLRLGMSLQQVLAVFPGSSKRKSLTEAIEKAKSTSNGEPVPVVFEPATDAIGESFAGVESVATTCLKQRLIEFNISYVGITWTSVDQWIAKLSETLGLPGSPDWTAGPSENPNKVLKCQGIEIEASIQGGGASIRIQNTESKKAGVEAEVVKKQKEFKS